MNLLTKNCHMFSKYFGSFLTLELLLVIFFPKFLDLSSIVTEHLLPQGAAFRHRWATFFFSPKLELFNWWSMSPKYCSLFADIIVSCQNLDGASSEALPEPWLQSNLRSGCYEALGFRTNPRVFSVGEKCSYFFPRFHSKPKDPAREHALV